MTAHAIRAWMGWFSACEPPLQQRISIAMEKAVRFIVKAQRDDGSWIPLWFGNQHAPDQTNATYGTSRVLHALTGLREGEWKAKQQKKIARAISRATDWIVKAQTGDGAWSGFAGGPPSVEETALAVHALAKVLSISDESLEIAPGEVNSAMRRGVSWLIARVQDDTWTEPSPIGFYFAKLWYFEKIYPLAFTVAAFRAVDALLLQRVKR